MPINNKKIWVLNVVTIIALIFVIACGNSTAEPETGTTATQIKPTATKAENQIKPTATKASGMAPLATDSKVSDSRKPVIFSSLDNYPEFPEELQKEFKKIVDDEFSAISEKAGISVAVYTDGALWTYANGKASESSTLSTNTPLMISSTSKTFLSALILTQIEKGLYGLNDTIGIILSEHPDFSSLDTDKINPLVTIEELLTMSSGLPDYNENMQGKSELLKNPQMKPEDLINLINTPYTEPGTFKYNDTNVVILGMIAELYSGQTLSELYRQTFYDPLSITAITLPEEGIEWHSRITKDPADNFTLPTMAMPYSDISKWASGFGNMIDAAPFEFGYYIGSMGRTRYACCGIISTPENIARWAYHLYSPNGLAISESVRTQLKNSTAKTRMPPWSTSKRSDHIPVEYGYLVAKKTFQPRNAESPIATAYGHPGGGSGYSGTMHYSPELDLSISIIANSQMKTQGICGTDGPGDCITMRIFKSYKEQQATK